MSKHILLLAFVSIFILDVYSIGNSQYYSQYGQDKFLDDVFFLHKKNGFFIDIGAHNGITLSNTYFFEKKMGWRGICIEPYPDRFTELVKSRSAQTICLPCAIANSEGYADFLKIDGYAEMLSGLLDKYEPDHLKRVDCELSIYGGHKTLISVPVFKLRTILEQNQVKHVDLLSLDTEGSEFDILNSIDFDAVTIDVILVENNYKSTKINDFLTTKNYSKMFTIGVDEIYRHNAFVS